MVIASGYPSDEDRIHDTKYPKKVCILGSTGSIGTNALDVISTFPDRLDIVGLSAHSNIPLLHKQAEQYQPTYIVLTDKNNSQVDQSFPSNVEILYGIAGIQQLVQSEEIDIVLNGIMGAAGLSGTLAAVQAGKTVALANKESLVMAGSLVLEQMRDTGAKLIPVDSEHNAIFQILDGRRIQEVKQVVLTASGGPFRGMTREQLQNVTVEEALDHPTWKMGDKITIDSATLMNKTLEVIETHWLFGLSAEQISVIIHPESIIHSFVEFQDGSILAQLAPPDMRLPIQYALTYPERLTGPSEKLDWCELSSFHFEKPDTEVFPALELGYEVIRRGGTAGAVLNAANEAAVHRFLEGSLSFVEIPYLCRKILHDHPYQSHPTYEDLLQVDRWARTEVDHWKSRRVGSSVIC